MAGYNYGPIDPDLIKQQEKVASVMRTVLEKRKMAVGVPIPVQVLHDADISFLQDFMTDTVLMQLESHVFEEKVHHGKEVVRFSQTKYVPLMKDRWLIAANAVLAVYAVVSMLYHLDYSAIGAVAGMVLFTIYSVLSKPNEMSVTVSGEVEFDVDTLIRFPENTRVYPKELGRPYKYVEVNYYTTYDDGEEDE